MMRSSETVNERDKVLRKSRKTKEATDIARYKYLRNRANNMLKHARNKYQRNVITENALNPANFWRKNLRSLSYKK